MQKLKADQTKNILSQHRLAQFNTGYNIDEDKNVVPKIKKDTDRSNITATVTFSYVHDGLKYAAILSELLKKTVPNVTSTLLSGSAAAARREIDSCDIVIIFVTDEYIKSELHMQELHMALCRQRVTKNSTVIYLVQVRKEFIQLLF